MDFQTFLAELKRRHVVRVGVVYGVVGFVLVQVADLLVPALLLPDWTFRLVVLLVILGFPLALILAWAFDITPEGVVRTESEGEGPVEVGAGREAGEAGQARTRGPFRPAAVMGGAALAGALVLLAFLRFGPDGSQPPAPIPAGRSPVIVVLPFTNLSADPDNQYFSEGVSEDILSHLARMGGLRVIGPASAARFRGTDRSVPEIARELGADAVLTGSVRKDDRRVRIGAQLVDGQTGEHRWAESYDRELADIFEVQTEVARRVARSLVATLSPSGEVRLRSVPTENVDAYNLYLMGRHLADRRGLAGLERARNHFREALEHDPDYALAHTGLAEAYAQLGTWGALPADSAFAAAREAAERARELDPTLAAAWASLGYVRFWYDWDWEGAEAAFREAVELNPNHATGHHWFSLLLVALGRFDEAEAAIARAADLEPLSRIIRTILGRLHWLAGDPKTAIREHRTALELDPGYAVGHMWLALAHLADGATEEAVGHLRRGWEIEPEDPVLQAGLALSHALLREREEALEVLANLDRRTESGAPVPFWSAMVLVRLGEVDRAFAQLERAFDERDGWLTELKVNPLLDPLRNDPRYHDLLERMELG